MNIQDWFPLGWTGWLSFQSKGLSRGFSNITVQKHWSIKLKKMSEIMIKIRDIEGSFYSTKNAWISDYNIEEDCNFTLLLLLLSHFNHVQLCVTPWTAAYQAPLSMEFSRQEYWSGLPFPSPFPLLQKIKLKQTTTFHKANEIFFQRWGTQDKIFECSTKILYFSITIQKFSNWIKKHNLNTHFPRGIPKIKWH